MPRRTLVTALLAAALAALLAAPAFAAASRPHPRHHWRCGRGHRRYSRRRHHHRGVLPLQVLQEEEAGCRCRRTLRRGTPPGLTPPHSRRACGGGRSRWLRVPPACPSRRRWSIPLCRVIPSAEPSSARSAASLSKRERPFALIAGPAYGCSGRGLIKVHQLQN